MDSTEQVKSSVEQLNQIADRLADQQIDNEQAIELLKQSTQIAADALEQLERLVQDSSDRE